MQHTQQNFYVKILKKSLFTTTEVIESEFDVHLLESQFTLNYTPIILNVRKS